MSILGGGDSSGTQKGFSRDESFVVTVSSATCSDRGGEYKIYTDIGEFRISAADYRQLGLPSLEKEDGYPCGIRVLSENHLEFLAEKLSAVKYLSWFLTFGDKSEKALIAKLKEKEFSPEAAQAATELLKKNGILDETAICTRKIRAYAETKGFGPYRIKRELKAKGFTDYSIRAAFELAENEIDFGEVLEKLCKKLVVRKKITDKNKLTSSLSRYGYGYSDIKEVIGKYINDKNSGRYYSEGDDFDDEFPDDE